MKNVNFARRGLLVAAHGVEPCDSFRGLVPGYARAPRGMLPIQTNTCHNDREGGLEPPTPWF